MIKWPLQQHIPVRLFRIVLPWLAFAMMLMWGWRVYDIVNRIPAYGDALEVIWGIQQYHDALANGQPLPLYTPLVFAPNGWHTATLAHTPFLFLLAQPFCFIGGAAFAYNLLALISLVVAYAGSMKLLRRYVSAMPATAGALIFTFVNARWFRIFGHFHILWATSLLPWLLIVLSKLAHDEMDKKQSLKLQILAGAFWGGMINFSYYSIFLGAVAFAIWGKQFFRLRYLKQAAVIAFIAVLLSAPTLILYEIGSRQDDAKPWTISGVQIWGASLNGLMDISWLHPINILKQISVAIYSGPGDESGIHQYGLVTGLLALLGAALICRKRPNRTGLLWLAGVGLLLSLGLLLKWNGKEVSLPALQPLDDLLWRLGHFLKPDVFASDLPRPPFDRGIPLPGYVLAVFVPFYESARVVARYSLVADLGLIVIAAIGLDHLPALGRWIIAAIWILEGLPLVTNAGLPMTSIKPHPAYAWLAEQPLAEGENIIEITNPTIAIGGDVILATQYHHKPTVSGVGSYLPEHVRYIYEYLADDVAHHGGQTLSTETFARLLNQYGARYALFQIKDTWSKSMWNLAQKNPQLRALKCYDPNPGVSPWNYPICVAEVLPQPVNVIALDGWYPSEEWGVWAEGVNSQAKWVATAQMDYQLTISAFPYCAAHDTTTTQTVQLEVNGELLISHTWTRCEVWHGTVTIPKSQIVVGENNLAFSYANATRPSEREPGNGDTRQLSVGFTQLSVKRK
jgi:hypothetical protein